MAVPPLEALVEAGHEIALVVTRADARRSRRGALTPSPVKAAALELGLPVTHDIDDLVGVTRAQGVELGVVVAYGRIIRPHVLEVLPMINLHFSLLPRWRGAAPVERALLAGDEVTGVCLMQVEEGLDTGGVHARVDVPISPTTTAAELRTQLVDAGTRLLVDALDRGLAPPVPQLGAPTYAEKLTSADLRLDWHRSADEIHRLVRVGGAWTTFRGSRVKILEAAIVDGALEPVVVQPEGRAPMSYRDWRNGARPLDGEWFE
jgi:methionyl-tRNA formyltransferase